MTAFPRKFVCFAALAASAILAPWSRLIQSAPPHAAPSSQVRDEAVPESGRRPGNGTAAPDAPPPAPGLRRVLGSFAVLQRKAVRSLEQELEHKRLLTEVATLEAVADRLARGDFAGAGAEEWTDAELGVPDGFLAAAAAETEGLVRLVHVDLLAEAVLWSENPAYEAAWRAIEGLVATSEGIEDREALGHRLELITALRRADPERAAALLARLESSKSHARLLEKARAFGLVSRSETRGTEGGDL